MKYSIAVILNTLLAFFVLFGGQSLGKIIKWGDVLNDEAQFWKSKIFIPAKPGYIPNACRPRDQDVYFYVLSKNEVLRVSNQSINKSKFGETYEFNILGYIGFDANGSGVPESYAFGVIRSHGGGRSYLEYELKREKEAEQAGQAKQDVNSFDKNFSKGISLRLPDIFGSTDDMNHQPTPIIRVNDWNCFLVTYENGDILYFKDYTFTK